MSDIERFELAFYLPPTAPDLPDYLRSLQELGIRHIGTDGFTAWRDPATHERLGETFERFDMQVVSVHSSIGLMWPDPADLDKSLKDNQIIIDLAACWHCPRTVWHMGWFRGGSDGNWADPTLMDTMDVAEIHRRLGPVLRETCARAAEKGVEINLENMPLFRFGRDTREIIQFIRQQDLPNLGLILDSGHAWASNEDPAELIREAGDLLRDTHFHDNFGAQGFDFSTPATPADSGCRDMHSIVGLGTINWLEVVRALREIKFAGPVVFEGPKLPGHPDSSVAQWRRCVDLTIRMWRAFEELATYYEPPAGQQQ